MKELPTLEFVLGRLRQSIKLRKKLRINIDGAFCGVLVVFHVIEITQDLFCCA
jgi:hypothetical protein